MMRVKTVKKMDGLEDFPNKIEQSKAKQNTLKQSKANQNRVRLYNRK